MLKKDKFAYLLKFFEYAQNKLEGSNDIDAKVSGSTAVTLFKINERLICANIGDSRAILVKRSQKFLSDNHTIAIPLSFDHKPTCPAEKRRILKLGGEIKPIEDELDFPEEEQVQRIWVKGKDYPGLGVSRSIGDL